jgi:serine protease DegS/serine protease DegQ
MKNVRSTLIFIARFAVLGLALAFVATVFAPQMTARVRAAFGMDAGKAPAVAATSTETPAHIAAGTEREPASTLPAAIDRERGPDGLAVSYAGAVARAAPAVVSIFANRLVTTRQVLTPPPLMRQMFPGLVVGQSQQLQRSLGSGVIVSGDGYILTNNHVIQGAEEINAILKDGRVAKAEIVGSDPETDLAVLKLDAENLPTISITDGTPLNVGDVVLAIGNPFGLGNTVTMGIISALGRQLHKSTYEDFIQTDAAINQGNSGGALVNAYGELVGINSDVLSPSGGSIGIGFAIPVATAKVVLDQIVAHGKVIRGWIGAEYADIPSAQANAPAHGVLVQGVYDKGPAALAGLRGGDVLLRMNDEPISSQLELRNREASLAPGTKVKLAGLRDGKAFMIELTLQERPQLRQSGS